MSITPPPRGTAILIGLYALAGYVSGTAGFVLLIVFLANGSELIAVDLGTRRPLAEALVINTALMLAWTAQHIGMARRAWKSRLAQLLPPAVERSTYMLFTGLAAALLVFCWSPLPATIWDLRQTGAAGLLTSLYWFGWLYALAGILYDSYFEFHGLKQPYRYIRGESFSPARFSSGFLFRLSRRPTFFGILLACWATPHMTLGHLYFSLLMTAFTLVGARCVERSYPATVRGGLREEQRRKPLIIPDPRLAFTPHEALR